MSLSSPGNSSAATRSAGVRTPDTQETSSDLLAQIGEAGQLLADVRFAVGSHIFGQNNVIEQTMVSVLSGGHVLFVGVPGLGKTRLVETLGKVLGLEEKRVQCTPDLMPADILGSEVLEENNLGRRDFRFIPGPVFCQLFMADEINRASPRTQSALLQAMQEKRVTIAGHYHPLPEPFHVLATQNPLEQEGTYPLPEAQLDRFLMQIDITWPDEDAERRMLLATTGVREEPPVTILSPQKLMEIQALVRRMPIGESVVQAILDLVRSARPGPDAPDFVRRNVAWGPGPRASQALSLAVRARALLDGRLAPCIDDVLALALPVLRHRMAPGFAARADGITLDTIISRLCAPLKG